MTIFTTYLIIEYRKKTSMKNKFIKSIMIAATIAISAITPAHAQNSNPVDTHVYVGKQNCNDSGSGRSQQPFCTLNAASQYLDSQYNAGKARGDVYVRFKTSNNAVYNVGTKSIDNTFTFSPAAEKRVYIVPDWYKSRSAMSSAKRSNYAKIRGTNVYGEANRTGITISPNKNRGGSFVISGLDIRNVNNGLMLNGGVTTKGKTPEKNMKNVVQGNKAPINDPIIEYNTFDRIGGKYAKINETSYAALRIWNTTDGRFTNNTITNIDGDGHTHAVYGYVASNLNISNNYLDKIKAGSTFRYRQGGNWNISNNTIKLFTVSTGSHGYVSQWYQGKSHESSSKYAECRYPNATTRGISSFRIKDEAGAQQSWCLSSSRIFPPSYLSGQQTSKNAYTIQWSPARTQNSNTAIKEYKIYVNGLNVATVPASQNKFVITNDILKKAKSSTGKEFNYAVVAFSNKGTSSSRNANISYGFIDPTRNSSAKNVSSNADTPANYRNRSITLGSQI